MKEFFTPSNSDFSIARFKGGLSHLNALKDQFYNHSKQAKAVTSIRQSDAFRVGFSISQTTPDRGAVSAEWLEIIARLQKSNPGQRLNQLICEDVALLAKFEQDWIYGTLDKILRTLNLNGSAVIWSWNVYRDGPGVDDFNASAVWQFDIQHPETYFQVTHYLTDREQDNYGIEFLPAAQSFAISDRNEFIGLESDQVHDLLTIATSHEIGQITKIFPQAGDAIIYWPSRALRRVVTQNRKAPWTIVLSFIPALADANEDEDRAYSRPALQDLSSQNASTAFFVSTYSSKYRHSQTFIWDSTGEAPATIAAIFDAIIGSFDMSNPEQAEMFDIILHLSRFLPRGSIEQFLGATESLARFLAGTESNNPVTNYISNVRRENDRYSNRDWLGRAFWPDPTHPKHPSSLFGLRPFANTYNFIDKKTSIATAGSCFAFEISAILQKQGFNYLIAERPDDPSLGVFVDDYQPGGSVKFSANYGILFNSPSLVQLSERAFGLKQFKRILVKEADYFIDPYRENVYFRDQDAYDADYEHHTVALRRVFSEAEVFIFTLGLNECWQFRDDGSVISRNPRGSMLALLQHRRLTVAENVENISRFFEICRAHNPNMKLILTVSPIPFLATGLAETAHVVEANFHSKAVLRVAAQELADRYKEVYYFPSYEMVAHTIPDPWEPDLRHVKRSAVVEIVDAFKCMFSSAKSN